METISASPELFKTCARDGCNTQFTPSKFKPKQAYCSTSCKNKALTMKKKNHPLSGTTFSLPSNDSAENSGTAQQPAQIADVAVKASTSSLPMFAQPKTRSKDLAVPADLSPVAMYLIDNYKEQRDDWKGEWQEERRLRMEAEKKLVELEKQHLKIERDLADANKPKGLAGLGENPLMHKMIDHVGPAIGQLAMLLPGLLQQRAGAAPGAVPDGTSPAEGMTGISTYGQQFSAWMETLPESTQQVVWGMIMALAKVGDAEKVEYMVKFFLKQAANG